MRRVTTSSGRREEILSAAEKLFEERGYHGASLRMIAREAHISPSLLQKYFETKEAMLEEFIQSATDDLDAFDADVNRLLNSTADFHEAVTLVAMRYMKFLRAHRGFYLIWVSSPELISTYSPGLIDLIRSREDNLAGMFSGRTGLSVQEALVRVRLLSWTLFAWAMYYERVGAQGLEPTYSRVADLTGWMLSKV